jgi:predicted HNH restriction endonuclease
VDLRPVCPNCHAVLHHRVPAFSIEEVRTFLQLQHQT